MMENWEFRHLGVVVKDLDKTLDYYQQIGIATFDPAPVPVRERTDELVYGKPVKFKMRGKMVRMGDIILELLQPVEGDGLHMEFLKKYGEGVQHICFTVDDLEKERADMVARGMPVILIREDGSGFTYFDMRKQGNMIVELVQRRESPVPIPPIAEDNTWTFRHLGVVIGDLHKTMEYYQSLGMELRAQPPIASRTTNNEFIHGKLIEFTLRVSGANIGPTSFELLEPVKGQSPHMEFYQARGADGGHHISFAVPDLAKERDELVEKGVPIVLIREDKYFVTYFNTGKVGNILIELNQLDQGKFFFPGGKPPGDNKK